MNAAARSQQGDHDRLVVTAPLALRHRSGRTRLYAVETGNDAALPSDRNQTNDKSPRPARVPACRPLVLALKRAFEWRDRIESGAVASIPVLAASIGVDPAYVRRMLRLTLLAPELVECILAGDEPDGLSLERLRRIPVSWSDQRRWFNGGPLSPFGRRRHPGDPWLFAQHDRLLAVDQGPYMNQFRPPANADSLTRGNPCT